MDKDRKTYIISLENSVDETYIMALTDEQVKVFEWLKNMGYDFTIVTSAKNMIMALRKSSKWTMLRYSVNKCSSNKSAIDNNRSSMRNNCKTASFMYKNN